MDKMTNEAMADALLLRGSVAAAFELMHAASRIAEKHREYVVKDHKGKFTIDDNDIIQHWKNVAFIFQGCARKLGGNI